MKIHMEEKKENNPWIWIVFVIILLLMFVGGFLVGRYIYHVEPETVIEFKTDTIYKHSIDTIKVDKIVYKDKKVLDTIYVHDTVLVREQKVYEDSLSRIWISGIQPEIDSIQHFIPRDTVIVNNETTITKTVKKHWNWGVGLGAYVGAGAGYNPINNSFGVQAPEVGVGLIIGVIYTP